MRHHPKFDSYVDRKILSNEQTASRARSGVVMSYDKFTNTATVQLSAPDSDQLGDIITNVMCPSFPGVQMVSPEPGWMCWVAFMSINDDHNPIITHFFNHRYAKYQYPRQSNARNGITTYRTMI